MPQGEGVSRVVVLIFPKSWRWRWRWRWRCRCRAFFLSLPRAWGVSLCCAVRPLAVVVRWALAGSQRPQWAAVPPVSYPGTLGAGW